MTDAQIFDRLFNGGNYCDKYMLRFSHNEAGNIYLINDNQNLTYDGNLYLASSFEYHSPDSNGDGGQLTIHTNENNSQLINFLDTIDDTYELEVIGVLIEGTEVQRYRGFTHYHGEFTIDRNGNVDFTLGKDDRQEMTFIPYKYDTDNNVGNA